MKKNLFIASFPLFAALVSGCNSSEGGNEFDVKNYSGSWKGEYINNNKISITFRGSSSNYKIKDVYVGVNVAAGPSIGNIVSDARIMPDKSLEISQSPDVIWNKEGQAPFVKPKDTPMTLAPGKTGDELILNDKYTLTKVPDEE